MSAKRGRASKSSARPDDELLLRIRVIDPPPDVQFCIQGQKGEFLQQTRSGRGDLSFDAAVRVAIDRAGGAPRLLGRVVQGPPAARFVYICSGTYAGDPSSCWGRRAKVPLSAITAALIAKSRSGARLECGIQGKAGDGGPACASVPLLAGWKVTR